MKGILVSVNAYGCRQQEQEYASGSNSCKPLGSVCILVDLITDPQWLTTVAAAGVLFFCFDTYAIGFSKKSMFLIFHLYLDFDVKYRSLLIRPYCLHSHHVSSIGVSKLAQAGLTSITWTFLTRTRAQKGETVL